jgi:hydrogenase-4 component B
MTTMTLWTGPLLPLVALVWPLCLAAIVTLPPVRARAIRLLPLAPLPALVLAVTGGETPTTAPDILLGVTLGLDPARGLFLGLTAALWLIAGLAAQPMAGKPHGALFSGFWCLTLTGNLGVFLALDAVTFYVAFAAVSLAAWFLVVHDRTEKALRAGRVYIVIALSGEVALLIGLLLGIEAAGSTEIAAVREAIGHSGAPAVSLLVVGFGIKAGLVPLHIWLPLAHPAAPVPASAVLSGAIVKAGLFGMIQFLPDGAAGGALVFLGLAGAFGAALWGLTQHNPKAVLAYSTVSQMGLMILLVGTGGAARDLAAFYALHHGFAKGALFLLVGVMLAASTSRQRAICIAVAIAVAASVAGLPLTGGALAKAAAKPGLTETTATILSLASVTTTLILVWFLYRLWLVPKAEDPTGRGGLLPLAPPVVAGALALSVPWQLWTTWTGRELEYVLGSGAAFDALWPVLVALPLTALLLRWKLPERPPGDLLLVAERWLPRAVSVPDIPSPPQDAGRFLSALTGVIAAAERRLIRWSVGGTFLPVIVVLLLVLLG